MKPKNNQSNAAGSVAAPEKGYLAEKCLIFGENMRNARKERGFTSEALGRFLGISTAYVGLIERGERCPSLETFLKICDFFGESYEDMFKAKNALAISEKKASLGIGSAEKGQLVRKQKMIVGMLNTFNAEELDHIVGVIKSFKAFSHKSQAGRQDMEVADELGFTRDGIKNLI